MNAIVKGVRYMPSDINDLNNTIMTSAVSQMIFDELANQLRLICQKIRRIKN